MPKTISVLIAATIAALVAATPAAANQVPVTQYDLYRLPSHKPSLVVGAPGILANDSDPDGDPITAELLGEPASGTLVLRRNGRIVYTPNPGFSGLDSFMYLARDTPFTASQCCGHVYIIVTKPPEAANDAFAALSGVTRTLPAPGVLANDVADRVRLGDRPDHGTVALRSDGSFDYTADSAFVGTDTWSYEAIVDRETPVTATVTMRVKARNRGPRAVADSYVTEEDTPLFVGPPGVLGNDRDADGDPLTAEFVTAPFGDEFLFEPDGSFEYYPPSDYDSPVTFTYRADDGLLPSAPVTVEIEILAVNDPPFAEEDVYDLGGATTLEVGAPGVLANDSDPVEFDALTATRRGRTHRGTLDLRSNGSFTYVRTDGGVAPDSFRYEVRDSGGAIGNTVTVWIYP